jgi:hypothetical protein
MQMSEGRILRFISFSFLLPTSTPTPMWLERVKLVFSAGHNHFMQDDAGS